MPVAFDVASHPANEWSGYRYSSPEAVLRHACGPQYQNCKRVFQSSLQDEDLSRISPNSQGFVHAVLDAWGGHHHLRIRPDDVWTAILNQLNFYINAHAEGLRRYFVAHPGQEGLELGDFGWDFAAFARQMSLEIRKHVVDSTLVEWILPDFTTTTLHDRAVCSIVMMASLKQYVLSYITVYRIPTSTKDTFRTPAALPAAYLRSPSTERGLTGKIYNRRLDRLYELGDEPSVWAEMLRPIIRRFVRAFDGYPDVKFWEHVVHLDTECCGSDDLSGWLTAFCVWDHEGVWQPMVMPSVVPTKPVEEPISIATEAREKLSMKEKPGLGGFVKKLLTSRTARKRLEDAQHAAAHQEPESGSVMTMGRSYPCCQYTLDGVSYFTVTTNQIPAGYCEVDVTICAPMTHCTMIADHFAIAASAKESGGKLDTLSPSTHWIVFEKKSTSVE
ncbi:hypothetical protein L226DRAFT_612606 [Lentinus tigrinus ALCF2SS1-7]|uniref:uncharacterized protein n=1 Tax=Lentinus tigrinus ALCF2SS1-7 TaxID=1328758 RepID=UPI001165CA95|nr:hypothetical protein L226DRAFT_612606 [Lentinus tigrinus ALCF2SS1-7]